MEPQQVIHPKHHVFKKVIATVLAIVLIVVGVMFFEKSISHAPALSDEQMKLEALARLDSSSKPITATLQDRTNSLQQLNTTSGPVTAPPEERLQTLETLSQ